jgi:hypothetical protein
VPFGARIVASTNAPSVPAFAIEQPSPSCHGVARPAALSGLAGTASVQFIEAAACAAVWFRLMGVAPAAPLTGAVATSPSWDWAVLPLANEFAGATVAAAPVLVAVAEADAVAVVDAVALAEADGLAVG